jgi:hypothetical protein
MVSARLNRLLRQSGVIEKLSLKVENRPHNLRTGYKAVSSTSSFSLETFNPPDNPSVAQDGESCPAFSGQVQSRCAEANNVASRSDGQPPQMLTHSIVSSPQLAFDAVRRCRFRLLGTCPGSHPCCSPSVRRGAKRPHSTWPDHPGPTRARCPCHQTLCGLAILAMLGRHGQDARATRFHGLVSGQLLGCHPLVNPAIFALEPQHGE